MAASTARRSSLPCSSDGDGGCPIWISDRSLVSYVCSEAVFPGGPTLSTGVLTLQKQEEL